jgi:hypothetical protein
MTKLLTQFAESPTLANARRVVAYARKHPMAASLLTREQAELVAYAQVVVLDGEG